jgi:hypothetical protein
MEHRTREDGENLAPTEAKKVPSEKPSFASTTDDPLATAGTGGSDDPKGKVRPGGGHVPADSDEFERRAARLDEAEAEAKAPTNDLSSQEGGRR